MKHLDEIRVIDGPIRNLLRKLFDGDNTTTKEKEPNVITTKPPTTTTVDLTPIDLATMYANNKDYGKNRYIDTNALRRQDNFMISKNVGLLQRKALAQAYHQEGNKSTPHGNGAYGLVGWRGNRATPIINASEAQQFEYLYNTAVKAYNNEHWTDGGKGSGYKTGKEAYEAFINAKTEEEAAKALNYGYVRPPLEDREFRTKNIKLLFTKP